MKLICRCCPIDRDIYMWGLNNELDIVEIAEQILAMKMGDA